MPLFDEVPAKGRALQALKRLAEVTDGIGQHPFKIPVLQQDPTANSSCNLWLLSDGRLRGRLPSGTIVEFTKMTTPGSSTSSIPLPTVPAQPSAFVAEWTAVSSKSYIGSGAPYTADTHLHYGVSDTLGPKRCLWLFDYANIQATLAGSLITRIQFFFHNLNIIAGTSTQLAFGGFSGTTIPSAWPGLSNTGLTVGTFGQGESKYIDAHPTFAVNFRSGAITGLGIEQTTLIGGAAGYGSGVGDSGYPPRLRIEYLV